MREAEVLVCFRPSGREAYVLPGTRLIEAAAEAGLMIETPCGGQGICGRCRVRVATGATEPNTAERETFSSAELEQGWRLACQTTVSGPAEVEIPPESRAAAEHQILVRSSDAAGPSDDPPVRKRYVELSPPRRGDDAPDAARLERALGGGPLEIELSLLRELPGRMRQAQFHGTAVLSERRLLDFEPGNTETDAFAVAVDVGTTTIVASLLDIGTGSEWAVEAALNPQTRFGDDVLSRILFARQGTEQFKQLQQVVVDEIDEMIGRLCRRAGIPRERIYEISIAGNTAMQQLLSGVDASSLGESPFAPATGEALRVPAAELGLHIHPRGSAYVMPVIGGFVGGDTVAGVLATQLSDIEGPALLVDIGTNGEIVLQVGGRLRAASTAAGPAFEGARISCGMRGCAGAIEKVAVDGHLRINVIGNVPPVGLCGSGLIDAAAELLRHGLLTPQGRLLSADQLPAGAIPDLAERLVQHEGHAAFTLAAAAETGDRPILLTQRDFRELQLAAGAIRAGVAVLLRQSGVQPKDLRRVLIAGGFGNFIRRNNAQRIGLLPAQIEHARIRFLGNTSLAGARLTALSCRGRQTAEEIARRTEHVDLSTDAGFQQTFAESMIFPEA